jgi:methylglutaconyl-CoA hydratase
MPEIPGSVTVDVAAPPRVATIAFGGTKGNSLPGALLRDLARTIGEVSDRRDVHVIVLRTIGDGPFCAGASFDELSSIRDAQVGKEFFLGFARVILAMTRSPKTIVTRVQGKVVGGGVGIVAASDYAIAVESASIRLSELAVGIGPFVVGPAIERKIGPGPFSAMAIDADWRDARWAEQHGLYARVVEGLVALDEAVATFAGRLASSNPTALERIKAITWQGTEHWPQLLDERAAMSGTLVLSEYTRDAIGSFANRATRG